MLENFVVSSAMDAALPGSGLLSKLGSFGSAASGIGSLLGSLGGLFGDEDDGPNQEELLAMQLRHQYDWSAKAALEMPGTQVMGLRKAGLNPMLAIGKGIQAPDAARGTMGADDRQVGIQKRQLAINAAQQMSQLALQAAQVDLTKAQTAKAMAETRSEEQRPSNIAADTGLKTQSNNLAAIQQTLTAADVNLRRTQNAIQEWEEIATKMRTIYFLPEQYKQLQAQRSIVEEELKTAQRIGKLDATQYAEILGYIKRFFDAIPVKAR